MILLRYYYSCVREVILLVCCVLLLEKRAWNAVSEFVHDVSSSRNARNQWQHQPMKFMFSVDGLNSKNTFLSNVIYVTI